MADGGDYTAQNAALLGRSLGTTFAPKKKKGDNESEWGTGLGSFHEKIPLPGGLIDGSGHQLWSAAAFINVCFRAGLLADEVRRGEVEAPVLVPPTDGKMSSAAPMPPIRINRPSVKRA